MHDFITESERLYVKTNTVDGTMSDGLTRLRAHIDASGDRVIRVGGQVVSVIRGELL